MAAAKEEDWVEVLTRLMGDCRAGWTKGARRRFAVEEGAGLWSEAIDLAGVLALVSFPFACLRGRPGVRAGVLDKDKDAYDNDVAVVVAVVALSLLFLLAFLLADCFFFRTVAGGFRSI